MSPRRARPAAACALVVSALTAGLTAALTAAAPRAPASAASPVRFVFRVAPGVPGPVYVQVADVDNQAGWVRVTRLAGPRPGERVFLRERCEVEDCGAPAAVCGAGLPLVRDVAAGARAVEYRWDGATSAVDAATHCETRRPAPPGRYLARFCYARRADLAEGGGAPAPAAGGDQQGQVAAPTCRDVPFSLPGARRVVFEVPAG